jgi:DNA processing protein
MNDEITDERFLELSCWLALPYLRGIGRRTIHSIAARNRALDIPITRFFEMRKEELLARYDMPAGAELDLAGRKRALKVAKALTASALQAGVSVLTVADGTYPSAPLDSLRDDAPHILYLVGDASLLDKPGIAVVGTRNPSRKAKRAATACAGKIAVEGFNVVSGYAEGIDTLAHTAALKCNGTTTMVLPHGILRFRRKPGFPGRHVLEERALILSEFAPDSLLSRHTALTRNRTICALADAVLVVETQKKGGAVNAGRNALRLRKPLFVGAGETARSTPAGNRLLIGEGGTPITVLGTKGEPDLSPLFDAARSPRKPPQLKLNL